MIAKPTNLLEGPDMAAMLQHGAEEGQVILSCVATAYLDYAAALLRARHPGDLFDAGARFLAAGADIVNRSAGYMQSYRRVVTPTLNDA